MFARTMPAAGGCSGPAGGRPSGPGGSRRRTALGLLLGAMVACSTPIRHGLEEPAANEVAAALERAGISAEKARDDAVGGTGFVVKVDQGDAVRALEVLH